MLLLGIVTSLLLAATPAASSAPPSPNYTLPLLNTEGNTICSASLLSPTTVLTAAHCVDGKGDTAFLRCGKELMFGFVTEYDAQADLAIIDTLQECRSVTVLSVADKNPDEDTALRIFGFPAGGPRKVTAGVVSGYDSMVFEQHSWKPRFVMLSDAVIAGGSSGGPVIADGLLIGVVSAKICYNTPQGSVPACYAILVPVSEIRKFLFSD